MVTNRADAGSSAQNGSDLWQTPSPAQKTNAVPETWSSLIEIPPLISPAGSPDAPRLVSHRSTSEEILLEDELKLKTSAGSLLKQQLAKALTLLYWLETIGNPNWQMSSS